LKGNKILQDEKSINTTKSHVLHIEGELVKFKNKDLVKEQKIKKLNSENE